MCGICGFYNYTDKDVLADMCRTMVRRGPDDAGYFYRNGVGLGVRRLSIVDLSGGAQPIYNEKGDSAIVFNGEIYNHRELRSELTAAGHRFKTGSDTEAILHAYEEYGPSCVHRLRGIFAFAIFDGSRLFCARDRFGVKPFYYYFDGPTFFFASEVKALLAVPGAPREVNVEAVPAYLTLQYVPGQETMFKGIFKLRPGHWLTVNQNGVRVTEYWRLPHKRRLIDGDRRAVQDEVASLVDDAVRSRLMADVPIGALLSGGLDSSLVVAKAARFGSTRLKTFHIRFDEAPGFQDEARRAREVARWVGTEHYEVVAGPRSLELLPKVIYDLDEPIADQAALPTYLVCSLAREHVKVVLTGEGGDELFAGYPRYLLSRWADIFSSTPDGIKTAARRLAAVFNGSGDGAVRRRIHKLVNAYEDPARRHCAWVGRFGPGELDLLLADGVKSDGAFDRAVGVYADRYNALTDASELQKAIYADVGTWLVDDILTKVDKMSMAASVEARVPLLDHVLAEYVAVLPDRDRLGLWTTKKLLKSAAAGELPPSIIGRPKRAFTVPVGAWLARYGRDMTWDYLTDRIARERGFFNPGYVTDLLERYFSGRENQRAELTDKIWNLLCFEIWNRVFMDVCETTASDRREAVIVGA